MHRLCQRAAGGKQVCNAETTWTLHESGSIGRHPLILLDRLTE